MAAIDIFKGKDIHSRIEEDYFENIWVYPNNEMESCIDDDSCYTVVFNRESWDYEGGLMGDSCGQKTKVFSIEKTPKFILDTLEEIDKLKSCVFQYKNEVHDKTFGKISIK